MRYMFQSVCMSVCSDEDGRRYMFQFASAKWTVVRADLHSLGFQSYVTPAKLLRLLHAVLRSVKTVLIGGGEGLV